VPERGIAAIGRFARVVSGATAVANVFDLLADGLFEHAGIDAVAVFSLDADGKLHLAAARGIAAGVAAELPDRVAAAGPEFVAHYTHPLIAAGAIYGDVIMLSKTTAEPKHALVEAFTDLAAMSLGTTAHTTLLERSEKLRALGQMAAGISHDLKNILNPLAIHLQVVSRSLDRNKLDDARESIAEMKQALDRGVQTLDRLRSFSRKEGDARREVVSLDALAREAIAIGGSNVTADLHAPPAVRANGSEVVSALVNLVINAADAGARAITLRTGRDDAGSWVEVADDGPGMAPEIAKRVFEPFFTTKGEAGTGLGLAMVYATMERHDGSVTMETAPGKGTTFRLHFPVSV
jgi:signal transduction histidine kinase